MSEGHGTRKSGSTTNTSRDELRHISVVTLSITIFGLDSIRERISIFDHPYRSMQYKKIQYSIVRMLCYLLEQRWYPTTIITFRAKSSLDGKLSVMEGCKDQGPSWPKRTKRCVFHSNWTIERYIVVVASSIFIVCVRVRYIIHRYDLNILSSV